MPNKYQVSVIIPVYNAFPYLRECLNSVREQTLHAQEIICIDDGSSDGSAAILAEYAQQDDRIRVITQPNAGLSSARNAGLQNAAGDYIYFLDSDDYLERNALERLFETAVLHDLDILYFDGASFYETTKLEELMKGYESYYIRRGRYDEAVPGRTLFTSLMKAKEYRPSACMQFLKASFLHEHAFSFHNGIIFEDNIFTFQTILCARRAMCIPDVLYHRRIHDDSIVTSKAGGKHAKSYFLCYVHMMRFALDAGLSLQEMQAAENLLHTMYAKAQENYLHLPFRERRASILQDPELRMLRFLTVRTLLPARLGKIYGKLRAIPLLRRLIRYPRMLLSRLIGRS